MYLKLAEDVDRSKVLFHINQFYEESPFSPSVSYNEQKVSQLFDQFLTLGPKNILFLLLMKEDQPVGLLVGFATTTPFSDDLIASELAWYIEPQHRGNRKAVDLVLAYETWARTVGCKHVSMSLLSDLTDVSKFYEKLGYKQTEISFLKEL